MLQRNAARLVELVALDKPHGTPTGQTMARVGNRVGFPLSSHSPGGGPAIWVPGWLLADSTPILQIDAHQITPRTAEIASTLRLGA